MPPMLMVASGRVKKQDRSVYSVHLVFRPGGIVCTNDRNMAIEVEALMWAGRKVGRPWYEFHRLGWNYRLTEFQAAILQGQLGRLSEHNCHRQEMGNYLSSKLSQIEGLSPLVVDKRTTIHGYHIYMVRYNEKITGVTKKKFLEALNAEGVPVTGGYAFALYKNPMFLKKQFINGSFPLGTAYHEDIDYAAFEKKCPVSERACNSEAIWLPQNILLGTEQDMDDVVKAVHKVLDHKNELQD
jgi:dTDP-4-amino-4,6-dideoxygalactose transaminase